MIDTIIIPVLNRYDLLDRCLASLGAAKNVIIIDNGFLLDELDIRLWRLDYGLRDVDRIHVVPCLSNLGVATSWNLGIKMSPHATGWLLLNNDAYFADGAYDVFAADTQDAMVVQAGSPPWCCTWISSEAVKRVGLFCERFYPAYMEDVDWERRARICGVDFASSSAVVHHDNSSTISSDDEMRAANQRTHATNHAFYEYRWANTAASGLPEQHEWSLSTRLGNDW